MTAHTDAAPIGEARSHRQGLAQLRSALWRDKKALIGTVILTVFIAAALFGGFEAVGNLMLLVFTEPASRTFYADWPVVAADAVAGFRMSYGTDPDDPRVQEVLAQLLATSEEFRRLWARHDARRKSASVKRFHHPEVGTLTLTMQTFDVRSAPGQELVVYDAEPGGPDADALAILGSVAAQR